MLELPERRTGGWRKRWGAEFIQAILKPEGIFLFSRKKNCKSVILMNRDDPSCIYSVFAVKYMLCLSLLPFVFNPKL